MQSNAVLNLNIVYLLSITSALVFHILKFPTLTTAFVVLFSILGKTNVHYNNVSYRNLGQKEQKDAAVSKQFTLIMTS